MTPPRNPPWAYDEIILALDLYLRQGQLDDTESAVVELSDILNDLPIHTTRPDAEKFRNPNGVAMKLGNFRALDSSDPAQGLSGGSKRDREVWERYASDPDFVHELAQRIREGTRGESDFPAVPEPGEDEVTEGRLLYRRHRVRERNRNISRRKKQSVLSRDGSLACEVCGFDFAKTYGDLGAGYIECHHLVPLAEAGETTTKLQDLAVVCSNCHRMLHRREPWPTIEELRDLVG